MEYKCEDYYSKIAEEYVKSKNSPHDLACINPSFESLFKDLDSQDVIDFGCGTGFYT